MQFGASINQHSLRTVAEIASAMSNSGLHAEFSSIDGGHLSIKARYTDRATNKRDVELIVSDMDSDLGCRVVIKEGNKTDTVNVVRFDPEREMDKVLRELNFDLSPSISKGRTGI